MSTQELPHRRTRHKNDATTAAAPCLLGASRRRILLALLAATVVAAPALADNHYDRKNARGNQVILRAAAQDAGHVAAQYGLEIAGEIDNADGYAALLEAPESLTAQQIEELLAGDARVRSLSRAELAGLPTSAHIVPAQEDVDVDVAKAGDFTTPCLGQGFSDLLWSGYADQEAAREIALHEGHLAAGDCGSAVVAILDTGLDPDHPLLRDALVAGYDFILESYGIPSEPALLEQSIAAILEQSVAAILEQSIAAILEGEGEPLAFGSSGPILEQSIAAILEQEPLPPFYGHGTMVAGLVRLVAPGARIMPLRVFDSSGTAHVFDVVRAIYYAVDHGADVINMSFSMDTSSTELMRAMQYARRHGVVCVAAAGNQGRHARVYPAAYPDAVAVAALAGDELTAFSNFGSSLVNVAAPGNGVISAYPGGLYGAGWGTSFSAPLVAGTLALLVHLHPDKDTAAVHSMENALRQGSETIDALTSVVGSGRLDVLGTVLEAQQ